MTTGWPEVATEVCQEFPAVTWIPMCVACEVVSTPVSTVLMCVEIPEVCISLPLNRCVKAPEGMGAPFTMNTSTAETENFVYRPPLENADAVPSLHQKKHP